MMISCKTAARLSSEALERKLTFWERIRLRFHCRLCGWCCGHDKDLHSVRMACRHQSSDKSPTEELSPAAREKILSIVRQHLEESDGS